MATNNHTPPGEHAGRNPHGALALEIATILCDKDAQEHSITALNADTGRHFEIERFVDEQAAKKDLVFCPN